MPRQDASAPESPTDLEGHHWSAVLKRTARQFSQDKLTTWAAALTYYGILSIFPGLLALVSILGLVGQSATQPLLDNLGPITPGPARDILTNTLNNLGQNRGASTISFIIGLGAAIWSASGYIGAFMDASNNVWDVPEGRPIWKKLPLRLALTLLLLAPVPGRAAAAPRPGPPAPP